MTTMATTQAPPTTAALVMAEPATAGGVASLVRKLQHPLVRIRARAIANLLFKLREGLVDAAVQPPQLVDALARALLQCLAEPDLEVDALRVLEHLLQRSADVSAPLLAKHGAVIALQRGAIRACAELRPSYDSLLEQLLQTPPTASPELPASSAHAAAIDPPVQRLSSSPRSHVSKPPPPWEPEPKPSRASAMAKDVSISQLASAGWRFAPVELATVDEQFLFEFEVKWRLRTTVPEMVEMCDVFRRELLRDFPPEVFLQRPAILRHLLHLAQQPMLPEGTTQQLSLGACYFDEPGSSAFMWKPETRAAVLQVSSIKAIESFLSALRHALRTTLNPLNHVYESMQWQPHDVVALPHDHRRLLYPRVLASTKHTEDELRQREGEYSLSGVIYELFSAVLRLFNPHSPSPLLHLANLLSESVELLPERMIQRRGAIKALDKQRIEAILCMIEQAWTARRDGGDAFPAFVAWRLIDLITQLLQIHDPSDHMVASGEDVHSVQHDAVVIPRTLWELVLDRICDSRTASNWESQSERDQLLAFLNQIDESASQYVAKRLRSSLESSQLSDFLLQSGDVATDDMAMTLVALRALPIMPEHKSAQVVSAVTRAIQGTLEAESHASDLIGLNRVLIQLVGDASAATVRVQDLTRDMVRAVVELADRTDGDSAVGRGRRKNLLAAGTASGALLQNLLLLLATRTACAGDNASDPYWRLTKIVIEGFVTDTNDAINDVASSLPLLQHFAYAGLDGISQSEHEESLKRNIVDLVNQVESRSSNAEKVILIARCMIHNSSYIRNAAASGLFEILKHAVPVQMTTGESATMNDPFGQFDVSGVKRTLENDMAVLEHPTRPDINSKPSDRRSILTRVSTLRHLLCTIPSTGGSTLTSVLHEILLELKSMNVAEFSIADEAGELQTVLLYAVGLLHSLEGGQGEQRCAILSIVRVVLARSLAWRKRFRADEELLSVLMAHAFHASSRIRAVVFFAVLSLTCSIEVFVGTELADYSIVPMQAASTFGLFSNRWELYGIETCNFKNLLDDHSRAARQQCIDTIDNGDLSDSNNENFVETTWRRVTHSTSYRSFLDALYEMLQLCQASSRACEIVIARWDSALLPYLETPPTSAKDDVVRASLIGLVNAVLQKMDRDKQMQVVFVLRRSIIPHLKSHSTTSSSATVQLVRLFLQLSESKVSDVFLPLVIDTGLASLVSSSVTVSPMSNSLVYALSLELLHCIAKAVNRTPRTNDDHHKEVLRSAMPALLAIVSRHRVPGSFQLRGSLVAAVNCLVAMGERSQVNGGKYEAETELWSSRLLFDCSSTLRAVGFCLLSQVDLNSESGVRLFRLAADTMNEESECDVVRGAAASVVHDFLRNGIEREEIVHLAPYLGGREFVHKLLVSIQPGARGMSIRLRLEVARLLRFFLFRNEQLQNGFGDSRARFALVHSDNDSFRGVVELLSLRIAVDAYRSHCRKRMLMDAVPKEIWVDSLLPIVLKTILETARLLLALVLESSPLTAFLVKDTTLVLQLAETIIGIAESIKTPSTIRVEIRRLHYEALDELGRLFSLLVISPFDKQCQLIPSDLEAKLYTAMGSLFEPDHPVSFRGSFARVVSALITRFHGTDEDNRSSAVRASLCANLWTLFHEASESQPLDPLLLDRPNACRLDHADLRRVALALQSLTAQSPHTRREMLRRSAVKALMNSIKAAFGAIRLGGGFGAKASRSSDAFATQLCSHIELHFEVLTGVLTSEPSAQGEAMQLQLPAVVATNWNTMRMANQLGSRVMLRSLQLLQSYVFRNDDTKASLASATVKFGGAGRERVLLTLITQLSVQQGSTTATSLATTYPFDSNWPLVCCSILKSAMLNNECLQGAIKTGVITKLILNVVERSRQTTTTHSGVGSDESLARLLEVLASVACSDEGRHVILQVKELGDLINDILRFPEASQVLVSGSLFVRNMAFSKYSKSHFAVWEASMEQLLLCVRRVIASPVAGAHLSTAIWSLLFDNQRAQTMLLASPSAMSALHDSLRGWQMVSNKGDRATVAEIVHNLERVQHQMSESKHVEQRKP